MNIFDQEFIDVLKNVYSVMHDSYKGGGKIIYDKFQIKNFSIEQRFSFRLSSDLIDVNSILILKNDFYINILPQCHNYWTEIDEIEIEMKGKRGKREYVCNPRNCISSYGEYDKDWTTDEIASINNLLDSIDMYKYTLSQLDYLKVVNIINLFSVQYIWIFLYRNNRSERDKK